MPTLTKKQQNEYFSKSLTKDFCDELNILNSISTPFVLIWGDTENMGRKVLEVPMREIGESAYQAFGIMTGAKLSIEVLFEGIAFAASTGTVTDSIVTDDHDSMYISSGWTYREWCKKSNSPTVDPKDVVAVGGLAIVAGHLALANTDLLEKGVIYKLPPKSVKVHITEPKIKITENEFVIEVKYKFGV